MILTAFRRALGLLCALLAAGCGQQSAQAESWVRDCPGDAFCFERPAGLAPRPGQAIDSLAVAYRGEGMDLTIDYGRYAMSLTHLQQPRVESLAIDGRAARMLSEGPEFALELRNVHPQLPQPLHLTMVLRFTGEPSRAVALRLFGSVRFKLPR